MTTAPKKRDDPLSLDKDLAESKIQNRRTMQVQNQRPLSFVDSRSQLDEINAAEEGKMAQDLFGLPAVFNAETLKRNAKDEC